MNPLKSQRDRLRSARSGLGKRKWGGLLLRTVAVAILSIALPQTVAAHLSDSVTVFHCSFGDDWDVNYDGWPDRWVRRDGPEYPHYVNVAIQDDATVNGEKCLTIDLDGSAAAIVSPSIGVMSRFSYVFEAQLKAEGLAHSTVILTVEFCDSTGRVLQTAASDAIGNTNGWQTIRIGRVEPRDPAIDRAMIGLRVVRGNKGDLKGRVSLANVSLERLPRIDVTTNNPCNVYTELDGIEVECALSGIRERDPQIYFQLLDGSNHVLQSQHFQLKGKLIVSKPGRNAGAAEGGAGPEGYECTQKWRPKITEYGFYRVVVRMMDADATGGHRAPELQLEGRTVDLVVAPKLDMPRKGEFGWTLADGDQPLSFQELSRLLPLVGINWVKVPVWFDASDPRRGDDLIRFVELLGASHIDVVGIIDRPPNSADLGGHLPRDISIADVLSQDSASWSAALEPVMSRLALRVRWWQLGRDNDTSLIGLPTLNKRIGDLRTALFRFGQDVRMGLCADWEAAGSYTGDVAWDFTQLSTQSEASKKKVGDLSTKPRQISAQRWVTIDPPSLNSFQPQPSAADLATCAPNGLAAYGSTLPVGPWVQSALEVPQKLEAARVARSTAFVHSLISAKLNGAEAIVVGKPFNDQNGLMRASGMPAELLLPWRTTAAMLGGAQYLGVIQLPFGSENRVFLRPDGQVVMVVWNREPVRESLYLGAHVLQFDLLGRATPAEQQGSEQVVDVGPVPTFVLGLHEAIARWRIYAKFESRQVPSVFSKPHHNALTFKNFFPQGVGGSLKIVVLQDQAASEPTNHADTAAAGFAFDRWTIEPPQTTFQLAADAEMKFPFDVKLKNALYGTQPIRIDFTIEADERLQFSVYQDLAVGTEDLTLRVKTHLDKDGVLIVEQLMTNQTGRLADFKCNLRYKGSRGQRMQVYRLGKEPDRKIYRIPGGRELVRQRREMLLEIEEVNGSRMINYRFVASDYPLGRDASGGEVAAKTQRETTERDANVLRPLAKLGS